MTSGADLVERALAASRADGCVVVCSDTRTVDLRWANNGLTTTGARDRLTLTVVSVVGDRVGVRSVSPPTDVATLVAASEAAAAAAGPAPDAQPLVSGAADADFTDPAADGDVGVLRGLATGLGTCFGAAGRAGQVHYGFASHDLTTTWLGSSTGLRLRHVEPRGSVQLTAKEPATGGSAWVGAHTRDFTDIAVDSLDAELRRRLGWARRREDLGAGRYPTVLPPSAVADLLLTLYWSASARDARDGRTAFAAPGGGTRIGQQLAPSGFWLRSDVAGQPAQPFVSARASSGLVSVFDNGLGVGDSTWVDDGRLAALVHTRASAAAAGAAVTPYADTLQAGALGATGSTDDCVADVADGLLLTCLWYIRTVDPQTLLLTGLTRDGVYRVRDGEVTAAVTNFRWNASPLDVLAAVRRVGATVPTIPREWADTFSWTAMPTLVVDDFHLSSVSAAT